MAQGNGRGFGEGYTPGLKAFNRLLTAWRERGDMKGLELELTGASPSPGAAPT